MIRSHFFNFMLICLLPISARAQNEPLISYASYISSMVVQRSLSDAERTQIQQNGTNGLSTVIRAWFSEPTFLNSAQIYVDNLVRTSGVTSATDMNLPGYLGREIARRQRPYADLLTASSCYNASGQVVACDTGAPFTAGLLTTKAYMITKVGPYNIGRAGKLVSQFLCTTYPLPDADEPKAPASELINAFATTQGQISFGNGNNCYSCHSQFGHHAQFFIKFDLNGNYQVNATGLQNPSATDGFSQNNLLTSHFRSPARAASEASQFLGRPAANLAEAARNITQSSRFLPCAVENLMTHYLRLDTDVKMTIKRDLYIDIAQNARALHPEPSFSHLLTALFTHPYVIDSFLKSGVQP